MDTYDNMIPQDELNFIAEKYSEEINRYMNFHYPIIVEEFEGDGETLISASIPDLPGCNSVGKSADEAFSYLEDAKRSWFVLSFRKGSEPPLPSNKEGKVIDLISVSEETYLKIGRLSQASGIQFKEFIERVLDYCDVNSVYKTELTKGLFFTGIEMESKDEYKQSDPYRSFAA